MNDASKAAKSNVIIEHKLTPIKIEGEGALNKYQLRLGIKLKS